MDGIVEIILDVAEALLEAAMDKMGSKHGRVKAVLCLAGCLVVMSVLGILGVHWFANGDTVLGILMFIVDLLILGAFVASVFRKRR